MSTRINVAHCNLNYIQTMYSMTPILAGFAMELGLIIGQLWLGPLLRALSDADVTGGTKVLIDRTYPSMCVFSLCAGRDYRCHVASSNRY